MFRQSTMNYLHSYSEIIGYRFIHLVLMEIYILTWNTIIQITMMGLERLEKMI